jgi:hypothetical protein
MVNHRFGIVVPVNDYFKDAVAFCVGIDKRIAVDSRLGQDGIDEYKALPFAQVDMDSGRFDFVHLQVQHIDRVHIMNRLIGFGVGS